MELLAVFNLKNCLCNKASQAQELLFLSIVDAHFPRPAGKSLGRWSVCIGCGIGSSGSPQLYRLRFGMVVWHEILQSLWPTTMWSKRRKRMKKVGKDLDVVGRHSFPTFFPVLNFHSKITRNRFGNNLYSSIVIANHYRPQNLGLKDYWWHNFDVG